MRVYRQSTAKLTIVIMSGLKWHKPNRHGGLGDACPKCDKMSKKGDEPPGQ